MVGRVLDAIDDSGAADRTLVLFTSDNGCAPYIGVADLEQQGHFPSGPLRGYKSDAWEGGHRVPFIVRWPGVVEPGSVCDRLVHQADVMATFADIVGQPLPDNAGEDSFSLLPLLEGEDRDGPRDGGQPIDARTAGRSPRAVEADLRQGLRRLDQRGRRPARAALPPGRRSVGKPEPVCGPRRNRHAA